MAAPQLVKKTVTLTVESVTPNASGKVFTIATKVDDKPFALKMFASSYDKHKAVIVPGATVEVDIENKGDESKADWFILWPKSPGGGGGGYKGGGVTAKSDPAKNAVIEKANTRNNDTINECNIRNSITALAVAGVTAIGEEAKDANALRAWVEDVHKTVEDLVREANGG